MISRLSAHLALLLVVVLITVGIVVLIALHDAIPPELWAIDFGCLTAAGVAAPVVSAQTALPPGTRVIPPPPTS